MKKTIVIILTLLFILSFAKSSLAANPIDDLKPGEWYEVPNSKIRSVLPNPIPPGNGPESIVEAWNSGAYDTKRDRYIVTGGGHNDYGGNEIYAFDVNSLTWSRIWGPSQNIPGTQGACNSAYSDGNPVSRHTYDMLEYLPNIDRFFVGPGSLYCGSGGSDSAIWQFNFDTLTWQRKSDTPMGGGLELVSGYDSASGGRLYASGPESYRGLWEYNLASDSWIKRSGDSIGYGQTSTVDTKRRKLVSIGNGAVYVHDLTTFSQQRLSTSGDTAMANAYYPGVEYDPVSDRIVAWSGGADVYSLNLDTLIWTKISPSAANTVIPTNPPSQGTFNRWRYIPSKNAFIVVNSVDENVFIYKLSVDTSAPINLPLKTWIAKPAPKFWEGPCPDGGCKHVRIAHNPVNSRLYFLGGDYSGPISDTQSGRNELYSYSITDNNWRVETPYCAPAGQVQPSHPDEVGWTYDTNRNIFWMLPGYQWGPRGDCPNSIEVKGKMMTFNPVSGLWDVPQRNSGLTGESHASAVYDPVQDTILRFYGDSGGAGVEIYDVKADTWTNIFQAQDENGVALNGYGLGKEYYAADYKNRHIYMTNMYTGHLLRYDMNTRKIRFLTNTPTKLPNPGSQSSPALVWDSVNEVLLWPYHESHAGIVPKLYIYHPDTNTWEEELTFQPDGIQVTGNNGVFDPQQNALLIIGSSGTNAVPYLFLYRYGNGSQLTLKGDINQDNKVNILDVQKLVNIILGIDTATQAADVNGDSNINVLDVQTLVNIILGG